MAPQNAFYILMGVETLGPRMMKHVSNAEFIASFLEGNNLINWVSYPGLKSHKDFELATEIMPKGAGAIISFGIKGGMICFGKLSGKSALLKIFKENKFSFTKQQIDQIMPFLKKEAEKNKILTFSDIKKIAIKIK